MTNEDDGEIDDESPRSTARRALVVGGAGVTALAGLAYWGLRGRGAKSAAAAQKGGELVVAFDGTSSSRFGFDPHNSGFAPHNRIIRSIYDNLTLLLPDQTIGPWLARSWEISPDRTRYDFVLHQGVRFHDGAVFDAAAVKANFDRLADKSSTLYSRQSLGPYASSQVLAPNRLRVILSEPYEPLLRNLSMTKLAIVSPTAVKKYGKVFAQNPVGTGPFRFAGLTQGTEIWLERNPDYQWAPSTAAHNGPALLDRLTFKNVPEEATRVAVLQSGQALAADLIPPQNILALKADPNFQLLEKELLETNYSLGLNVAKAPWNDEDVRLAVRLSLDVDEIVKVIYLGTLPRAWSPLSPSMFGSAEKELTGSWKSDPVRAREILTQKGWIPGPDGVRVKDGKRLTISFIDTQGNREKRLDVVQLVRRQLAASGIDLNIDSEPGGSYAAKITANDFDMAGGASFHADPDILRTAYTPGVRSALTGNQVVDPEIIAWLAAGAREADLTRRAEFYRKAQRKIVEKTYAMPIYILIYNFAVSRRVHGVTIDAHGFPEFHGASISS
jgi:peptide/nickel transport system substrate-binding protein